MDLGFHSKQLGERGTEVAMFDYAVGAEELLGHRAIIYVPADSPVNMPGARQRFEERFEVVLYRDAADIVCDALYVIKRGRRGVVQNRVPELNHAFNDVDEPHGHRFAAVSRWLARRAAYCVRLPRGRTLRLPRIPRVEYVPHIIHPPLTSEDLRADLGIPDDAVVFGRHGAAGAFSIEFVRRAVEESVHQRRDVWFLLLNTDRFAEHDRIVHIPRTFEREDVCRFVNTCDYMIHAVAHGETFGLAVAEFAVAGVPVMTCLDSPDRAHLDLLRPNLLIGYRTYTDVLTNFVHLERRAAPVASDLVSRYGPHAVMERFSSVFLS